MRQGLATENRRESDKLDDDTTLASRDHAHRCGHHHRRLRDSVNIPCLGRCVADSDAGRRCAHEPSTSPDINHPADVCGNAGGVTQPSGNRWRNANAHSATGKR